MREVTKNTNLSAKIEEDGWIAWALGYVWPSAPAAPGDSQPEKEFRALVPYGAQRAGRQDAIGITVPAGNVNKK